MSGGCALWQRQLGVLSYCGHCGLRLFDGNDLQVASNLLIVKVATAVLLNSASLLAIYLQICFGNVRTIPSNRPSQAWNKGVKLNSAHPA